MHIMGSLLARLFGSSYFLHTVQRDTTVLHYRRNPTWRSLLLFLVFFALTHYISTQAEIPYLGYVCYALGVYFSYIATEKYEEVIFDKNKGTVSLMNSRFLGKHLLGYRRQIVSELSEIMTVMIDEQKVSPGGTGYTVVLVFLSGLTLSLTAQCTFGNKTEHQRVQAEVCKFLGIPCPPTTTSKSKSD
ncbi:cytochrome b-245 chaperone 1 homolog [Halichondria panicea]|uniref:cytochrome b-245 chaperone 1 homolog n=1 Tax=Halichondria panicea TaxID=6063 RepID=UPI00312B7A8C